MTFDKIALEYDKWFDLHSNTFQSELVALQKFITRKEKGAEIGVGTGRFAAALGIWDGIEPSENMAKLAKERGIRVKSGSAEELSYDSGEFDFLLMVTVDCFLDDVEKAYREALRVLKPGGNLIIGLLDREGHIVKKYLSEKSEDSIYRQARFHTVEETLKMLTKSGFNNFEICQTLMEAEPSEVEQPQCGYGSGGFVVIKAQKQAVTPSLFASKDYQASSVFKPENLLRESRRQNEIAQCDIPDICVLDPDGDVVNYLLKQGRAEVSKCWACYHSQLYSFNLKGVKVGIIPYVVGASYAVLVSEQLFVSGCKLLISITSAGIITEPDSNLRFALITESLRDEGTSYHYLPKEIPSKISEELLKSLTLKKNKLWFKAKSWTTDAPYRETAAAITNVKSQKVTCVEMEASALYAFAEAKQKDVICFAHLTNTMAQKEGDFEKGEHFGSIETLEVIEEVIKIRRENGL
ncbi:methyltransferase domain-containing protein [Marivirga sp.]|uniref:methyltransferase domain-containing protein n=1 Tax=Marivirga sp. TaxID=2018662 RepID=UPI003DA78542